MKNYVFWSIPGLVFAVIIIAWHVDKLESKVEELQRTQCLSVCR